MLKLELVLFVVCGTSGPVLAEIDSKSQEGIYY